ncbi:MAG: NAD-binding protein [Verrucomicrobiales bacterium]|nr:NAD-binding protein [Verrucomicrobiales bacterium]
MQKSYLRILTLVGTLVGLLLISTVLYMLGMGYLEGQSRGFWSSMEWAAETLSTTGYGADHSWRHPLMVIFVAAVQFVGVFLVFLIFPIVLIPVLEKRFATRLATQCPPLDGHVVVFRHGPAVATLLEELEASDVPTVVVEEDEAEARRLQDRRHRVVYGRLDEGILTRVRLNQARALIANSTDDGNAAAIITARQLGFEGDILALVEDPLHRQPMVLAGATAAYTPRHVLGAALAARASRRVSPTVAGIQQLGNKLQVNEVRITKDSRLAGKTLAEAQIGQNTGVTVIGQWIGGHLKVPVTPRTRLEPGGILVLVGSQESIAKFMDLCAGTHSLRRPGPFIIAGFGEVGGKVAELLHDAGEETRVIAAEAGEGVDVVGNVIDLQVLEQADVRNAQAVILAVGEDAITLLTTVILKDLAPAVPVIARVNRAANVERIYRAGADFALSISQVSGQLLARRLLGKRAVALDPGLRVMEVTARGLVGHHPAELRIRDQTGCSVAAVERAEELLTSFGADFRFQADDRVYICGSLDATQRFLEHYQSPRT